ncbi:LysR family transcriptional regulator [Marinilongibacter aquaticus]|uniref:winged helix-turn-helix domain-containing protein n=1 Tax=Marinilongibacter aquaticus TaxID=2975157 RepID=UPI0021BD4678|nr:LysR family transcriptional regulator [Marinilongibacter aquaticus]UBM59030.1 LysR family transcriptional regulator [Marinilongibacter aquaticus]
MAIHKIIKSDLKLEMKGIIRIVSENERFLGPGRMELLERIDRTGSISKAAKEMGMSYKKAWDMIFSMNQQTVKPLVITQTGGERGGGTVVTAEGKELIAAFKHIYSEFQNSLEEKLKAFLAS